MGEKGRPVKDGQLEIVAEQKKRKRRRTLFLNRNSLPRWMRRLVAPKNHTHEQEDARRRRQIKRGAVRGRGVVLLAEERAREVE